MPCRSDYMEPTATETYSHNTAKLIWVLSNKLDRETDQWIRDAANNSYGNHRRHNDLTAILCGLFSSMTEDQLNAFVYNGRDGDARKLADWWDNHQEVDARRKAEQQAKTDHYLKVSKGKTLLAQMSAEDRETVVLAINEAEV